MSPRRDLLAWDRALLRLRRPFAQLSEPRADHVAVACDEATGGIPVRRGPLMVAVSLARAPAPLAVSPSSRSLAASVDGAQLGAARLTLPPGSVAVIEVGGG